MRVTAAILLVACAVGLAAGQYQPNWQSIDSRPLPTWFDEAKVGIFLHWGVYSVPSWGTTGGAAGEWYWWDLDGAKNPAYIDFHNRTYGPNFQYQDFAPMFRAELFDPNAWASLFKAAGAKYVVLTSKHHEGFTNWPNPQSWNWNSVDNGPHMDLVKMVGDALRAQNITVGNYFSLFEWFNPLYLQDKANNFTTSTYVDEIMLPQVMDLVNHNQPELIWADGDWEANSSYWKSTTFLAWLYNNSPVKDTVIVNDRWGSDCPLKHGGYYSGGDRFTPGKLLGHKWEDALTVDTTTWGFKRNSDLSNYLTDLQIVQTLVQTVAFGGNMLLNVGPTHDGRIVPIFQERLLAMGNFLKINGDAIYASKPWTKVQNQTSANAYYTTKNNATLYVLIAPWPATQGQCTVNVTLTAPVPTSGSPTATLLGAGSNVPFTVLPKNAGITLTLPAPDRLGNVVDPNGLAVALTGFL